MFAVDQFLAGMIVLGSAMAGLVFLRFWRKTHDRLFALFGASFFLMAVNRAWLSVVGEAAESRTAIYLIRLLAFVIILVAIVDKNLAPRRARRRRRAAEGTAPRTLPAEAQRARP